MPQFACQPFVTADDVRNATCGCEIIEDDEIIESWIDMASDIIYVLTGGQITGVCTKTVRPVANCDLPCFSPRRRDMDYGMDRYALYGGLIPVSLRGPNTQIMQVKLDGEVMNPMNYAVVNGRHLIRRDDKRWPLGNDLTEDDDQEGTWSITFRFGREPDLLTVQATLELACELAKADQGRSNVFPPGVIAASVQGASVVVQDAVDQAANGQPGDASFPTVARLLAIYPPHLSAVYSPEIDAAFSLIEVAYPT